jgi:phage terminase large subunit
MMHEVDIDSTINYSYIDDHFNDNRGIVLVGSTRSGKTISALQWLLIQCLTDTGLHIVIGRDKLATIKETTLKDFEELCIGSNQYPALYPDLRIKDKNTRPKAEINGNTIEFIGLNDDPMRVYGLSCDIFYINEAVATYKHIFNQLNQRCRLGFILDCNPSEPNSWVYELDKRPDVLTFRTTYIDNPFLNSEIVKEIESYEPTAINIANGTADARMWSIYGQGEIYKGKEIVFPDWQTYTDEPEGNDYIFYGLDWGYNDPTACIKLTINGNKLYLRQIIYASELSYKDIAGILVQEADLMSGDTYLVCDKEKRSIDELIKENIPAIAANKPAGSIVQGIRKLKKYDIYIHEDSHAIQDEANNYKWKDYRRSIRCT